ncbi:A/G-specific adenine glycosylase [Erysipelothrix larvae]|uniref:Adenine DNA glycosylase n=1 Tax=Erysipelothrix larvae TaxID=1514105 RepID=A0A109UGI3_9FIRM|nr:A/G-specific adenine glycosylase [Erysipelothrix larvae]AMC92743.1 A/G-specific adenine glycosylase [Erysipelothrix larvae]
MEFTKRLLNWYHENKRDLPFRASKDPYHIWVSEIMAQQTQIATMIPYYNRWIESFPDVSTLAAADINDVLKHWEGLGYYNRARNLHKGALFVMEHFNGIIPSTKEELLLIPGIGDYTSSAIASIAFDQPEIVIDGNVKRVMARYLNYTENVNARKAHKVFESFLKKELIESKANPSDFNQAMMELGALVYTPSNTLCVGSPFKEMCAGYRGENIGQIPYIPKAKKVPSFKKTVWYYQQNHSLLVSTDDSDGLMKGLLRLPMTDGHQDTPPLLTLKHKFSHLEWDIHVHPLSEATSANENWHLMDLNEVNSKAMITAHKKILIAHLEQIKPSQ